MIRKNLDKLPIVRIILFLCILAFFYGFVTHKYKIFPYTFLNDSYKGVRELSHKIRGKRHWYYQKSDQTIIVPIYKKNDAYNGSTLITAIGKNNRLSATIVDMEGHPIQKWDIAWDEIWPDATHLPEKAVPKSKPGTHIHGSTIIDNGDLIFNFETLGLVRLDVCGRVVWRLPYRTHHSVNQDEYGNLWVPGQINHETPLPEYPNYKQPVVEPTILKISPDGKILSEISLIDLLRDNNLQSFLYMSAKDNRDTTISGDILHLNDVEIFPSSKEEGVFKAGDIMVSLRNINTILVFGSKDQKVKYMSIGGFVRQHDPDFIDGNTISIFDNNNIAPEKYGHHSRILIESAKNKQSYVYYTGTAENPFYTDIMGKHQWLPNGNMLITETMKGKAFEIDKFGNIVWEYINIVDGGYVGIVEEALRLPPKYTSEFYKERVKNCSN